MMAPTLVPMNELKTKTKISLLLLLIFCGLQVVDAQNSARIMFYNVENLFDTVDDTLKLDEEFLPGHDRYWSEYRFQTKLRRIYQVIMAASAEEPPVLIGLCEIENVEVLNQLLSKTPLGKMGYRFIHQESPDRRGIDVALLYQNERFTPITYKAIPVVDAINKQFKTRDILHVEGVISTDTLHVFVNHWPSKYGGVLESLPKRMLAAETLKKSILATLRSNSEASILVMGDFNDGPFEESLQLLVQDTILSSSETNRLLNFSVELTSKGKGSHKYQGKWEMLDQILVSENLTDRFGVTTKASNFQVFAPEFLLEPDDKYLGLKPKRTYLGFKYNDGFSDHLPVILDLMIP